MMAVMGNGKVGAVTDEDKMAKGGGGKDCV